MTTDTQLTEKHMSTLTTYWTQTRMGPRLILTDGKLTFQSATLADMSQRTEAIWDAALRDRYQRHIDGGKQLDGVYQLEPNLFQVAG